MKSEKEVSSRTIHIHNTNLHTFAIASLRHSPMSLLAWQGHYTKNCTSHLYFFGMGQWRSKWSTEIYIQWRTCGGRCLTSQWELKLNAHGTQDNISWFITGRVIKWTQTGCVLASSNYKTYFQDSVPGYPFQHHSCQAHKTCVFERKAGKGCSGMSFNLEWLMVGNQVE